ncbi:fungal specific transcription factor [Metarhizium rileyi]|uniref:Fungal specific transcription factor n=1 Tax=Metarhizium rileyi (strain RCEF 4871) TaxID=1649241 RepID=A0A167GM09_METRR|nr:fungal specific transcription factor [Metarhizium rileyi RCEF 4871]
MSSTPAYDPASVVRSYRSQKRQKPCDRCRERKLRCQTDSEPPCQRCRRNNSTCTFVGKPRRRPPQHDRDRRGRRGRPEPMSDEHTTPHGFTVFTRLHDGDLSSGISSSIDETAVTGAEKPPQVGAPGATFTRTLDTPALTGVHPHRPSTHQLAHCLDQIQGHTAQLLGGSSESDPWLLRHCRFDELGLRSFHKVHYRHAGGVPTRDRIPVHFLLSDDHLCEGAAAETRISSEGELRTELETLVSPIYGARLVRLFHKHVFPVLPVISPSELGLASTDSVPDRTSLDSTPTHLLAAMYGSALPFALNDDQLAVMHGYQQPPLDRIWRIVYKSIQEALHRPRLSTMQAALLYLHKTHDDRCRYASSDTPFMWSLMGSIVGLGHSLGLHLECRMFGIPAREKGLRRRLWWAVFIEDKWMSLLLGRPPYIRRNEWDTSELDSADFEPHSASYPETLGAGPYTAFRDMARLALVADSIQESLYSLHACQKLADDLQSSIQAAKPLFDQLNAWRASIPALEPYKACLSTMRSDTTTYPTTVYFAHLTLVVYVWRALLRPTVRSLPPPPIIEMDQPLHETQPLQDPAFLFEDLSWDFSELPEIELHLEEDVTETSATVKELHQAAQSCAGNLVNFTCQLTSSNFGEFWHSWSRVGYAVVSNFLMALLVQAPSSENALKAKQMLEHWRRVIRDQGKVSPVLTLAMTRLNAFYWAGLSETFCLPQHVQDVLQ